MIYAVVEIEKAQYKVNPQVDFVTSFIKGDPGAEVIISNILMLVEDGKVTIGAPVIPGKKLIAKVIAQEKGPKIKISKYKAKSRYQKTTGFRGQLTRLRIDDFGEEVEAKPKKAPPAKVASRKPKK